MQTAAADFLLSVAIGNTLQTGDSALPVNHAGGIAFQKGAASEHMDKIPFLYVRNVLWCNPTQYPSNCCWEDPSYTEVLQKKYLVLIGNRISSLHCDDRVNGLKLCYRWG